VVAAATTLAIASGLELSEHLRFDYHDESGIVGWVSVHAYPKQQDFFYFLLTMLGVPLVITLFWSGWAVCSLAIARWTRRPLDRVLMDTALATLPLLLAAGGVLYPDRSGWWGLGLPIGLTIAAGLGVSLRLRLGSPPNTPTARRPRSDGAKRPPMQHHRSRIESIARFGILYVALPVLIYLLTYSGATGGRIDLFHEGESLASFDEMLRGGIPYRDIYIQHGLFQDAWMPWIAAQLFEPTLGGVRTLERMLGPLGYVAIYLLGLQVYRGGPLTALALVLVVSAKGHWLLTRHGLGVLAFALVAAQLSDPGQRERGIGGFGWRLALAGLCTSLAFWYSADTGLLTLGAIGLFLLAYSLRTGAAPRERTLPLGCYGAGVAFGFGVVAAPFALEGALSDVFRNTWTQSIYQTRVWGLPFPPFASVVEPLAEMGIAGGWKRFLLSEGFRWYLPILVFLVSGAYLTYRGLVGGFWKSEGCVKLLLLLLGGIAFFRSALGRSDLRHLDNGSTFLWLLCLFPIDRGIARGLDRLRFGPASGGSHLRGALASAWVVAPLLALSWYAAEVQEPVRALRAEIERATRQPLRAGRGELELARVSGTRVPDSQLRTIRSVVHYIQSHSAAKDKIFDFSNQGAYYFFANRRSVTRYHQVCYAASREMQQEVVDALERDRTKLVIYKTGSWYDAIDGVPSELRHPLIAEYLAEHYEPAADIEGTQILKRRSGELD